MSCFISLNNAVSQFCTFLSLYILMMEAMESSDSSKNYELKSRGIYFPVLSSKFLLGNTRSATIRSVLMLPKD